MHQNTNHPKHSLGMELLCSLPVEPVAVALDELADDLGLGGVSEAHALIRNLRDSGLPIETGQLQHRWHASVSRSDWPFVRRAAQTYWRCVYAHDDEQQLEQGHESDPSPQPERSSAC